MRDFLIRNRAELIERCKAKVSQRRPRDATEEQLKNGIPLFLDQLTRTLDAESAGRSDESTRISGDSGGGMSSAVSEIGVGATAHGGQLLALGYTVDEVVHGYGDLCQAISDMAVERDAPFRVDQFRTLNRCLDNAIAEAVTEFSKQREVEESHRLTSEANAQHGILLHELRNSLHTATLALTALEAGGLPIVGATGGVLRRSLTALNSLVSHALDDVRAAAPPDHVEVFSLASFIAAAGNAAGLNANACGCAFAVKNSIDPDIAVEGDRQLLLGAVMNLVQNAFKFTRRGTEVRLTAHPGSDENAIAIDVQDECGGLPPGIIDVIFAPFTRRNGDRSGLGLGLSIARQNVEASGGILTVRDRPGTGCVFTVNLRRHERRAAVADPLGPGLSGATRS